MWPCLLRPELAETNTWRLTCGPSYEVFGRRHHERRRLLGGRRPKSARARSRGELGRRFGGRALWGFEFRAGFGGGRDSRRDAAWIGVPRRAGKRAIGVSVAA